MMPSLSVVHTRAVAAQERRARALLAAEAERCRRSSPSTNHLKPTGTSYSARPSFAATRSIMLLLTTVLPTAGVRAPLRPVREQILQCRPRDSDWAAAGRRSCVDDAVAVVIGVAGEGDVEPILQPISRCIA